MSLWDYRNMLFPFGIGGNGGGGLPTTPPFTEFLTYYATVPQPEDGIYVGDTVGILDRAEYQDVNAMEFDGVDGQLATTRQVIDSSSTFDMSCWVKMDTVVNDMQFITQGATDGALGMKVLTPSTLRAVLRPIGSTAITLDVPYTVETDTWYHMRLTWNGTDTLSYYVNGILEGQKVQATPVNPFDNMPIIFSNQFAISGSAVRFDGVMSDMRIIIDDVESRHPVCENGTGSADGSTVADSSGNGFTATASGGVSWTRVSGVPSLNLKHGHTPALVSDATGQYIETDIARNGVGRVVAKFIPYGSTSNNVLIGMGNVSGAGERGSILLQSGGRVFLTDDGVSYSSATATYVKLNVVNTLDFNYLTRSYVYNGVELPLTPNTGLGHVGDVQLLSRNSGDPAVAFDGELFEMQLYDNSGVLIHDFFPLPNGDGMYDKVSRQVFGNDGAGSFKTKYAPALVPQVLEDTPYAVYADGASSVDTDISCKDIGRLEIRTYGLESQQMMHGGTGDGNFMFGGFANTGVRLWYGDANTADLSGVDRTLWHDYVVDVVEGVSATIFVDGTEEGVINTGSLVAPDGNFFLYNRAQTSGFWWLGAVEYARFYNHDGDLIGDFTPAENGTFYDRVSGSTFGNAASGTLTSLYNYRDEPNTVAISTFDGGTTVNTGIITGQFDYIHKTGVFDITCEVWPEDTGAANWICGKQNSSGQNGFSIAVNVNGRPQLNLSNVDGYIVQAIGTAQQEVVYGQKNTLRFVGDGSGCTVYTNDSVGFYKAFNTVPYDSGDGSFRFEVGRRYPAQTSFFTGSIGKIDIDGWVYDPSDVLGKTSPTVSGYNIATSDYEVFWSRRVPDPYGHKVDAVNYLLLEWEGGYPHNNCEVGILQTDLKLRNYQIYADGVYDPVFFGMEYSGKAQLNNVSLNRAVVWNGPVTGEWGIWQNDPPDMISENPADIGYWPPVTGWSDAPDGLQLLPMFWSDDTENMSKRYFTDFVDHPNGDDNLYTNFECVNGNPHLSDFGQYSFFFNPTPAQKLYLLLYYRWCETGGS